MKEKISILIVEDRAILAQDIADRLEQFGYSQIIGPFSSGEEALKCCRESMPDIAILDINLNGEMNGMELSSHLNAIKATPVIFLTQDQNSATLDESLKRGAVSFINKPFTNNELRMAVHQAIDRLGTEVMPMSRIDTEDIQVLDDRIFVRNGRGKYAITLDDVLWIKSGGGETSTIMTSDYDAKKNKPMPVVGYNLSKLEDKLAFYPTLIRCSRYYITNLRHVERIVDITSANKTQKTLIIGGLQIAVGDKYRKDVMDRLHVL